jgi:hypothetical protein
MHRFLLFPALILVAAACSSGERGSRALSGEDGAALLENRNWMDRWPGSDREQLRVYRFTPAMGGGVFQDRTLFAGHFELFNYEIGAGEIRISWPHTSERETVRFTVEEVSGPPPFDLRLTLHGNLRGPSVYHGRRAETGAADGAGLMIDPSIQP